MNCKKCRAQIFEDRDGTLSPRQRVELDAHLETCPQCRAKFEGEENLATELQSSYKAVTGPLAFNPPFVHSPAEFSGSFKLRPLRWLAAGAGAAIILAVLLLGPFKSGKRGTFPSAALKAQLSNLRSDDLADPFQDWIEKRMIITVEDKSAGTTEKYLTDREGTIRKIVEQGRN
jgi:predicted anti-sigma-YlaC factor YlaD